MKINFTENTNLQDRIAEMSGGLTFGRHYTDYMFTADFTPENGWHNNEIKPYAPFNMDPASSCLHYGQLFFEGMKCYKQQNGSLALFRPMENFKRMNESAWRMCMPEMDPEDAMKALVELIKVEREWVPDIPESSLYIRPFMMATDPYIGLRPSVNYMFAIILSPVGPFYGADGLTLVKIFVENKFVRAVKGGTGYAKCAGNYGASMRSQTEALKKGYNQVLWLDGIERKYIEEVGAMNVFFVIDGEVVTPELGGTILPGITRMSVIELLQEMNIKVTEKRISIDELWEAYQDGKLEEAFGTGTASVIAPIGELMWGDKPMILSDNSVGKITRKIYDELTGIYYGTVKDKFGWTQIIN